MSARSVLLRLSLAVLLLSSAPAPLRAEAPDGPVDGFGSELPLGRSIGDIVPGNLHVVIANAVDPAARISWRGGSSWKTVLRTALSKVGLVARIGDAEIVVERAPPPPQAWEVIAGETVAQTILRWSRQAGYTPVPAFSTRERWRLFVSQKYEGGFEDALEWLSKGFSRQPSKPVFYLGANKTIDILSRPTGVTAADAETGQF